MTRNKSMSMKAMFLLLVFLLNTGTGFACAIGMDMGYNKNHHQPEIPVEHHSYEYKHSHKHRDGSKHLHADPGDPKHTQKQRGEKENCCKDAVAKLTASDKLIQRIVDLKLFSITFILSPNIGYQYGQIISLPVNVPNAYFSRHCRSPILDVRIAIQSFQI